MPKRKEGEAGSWWPFALVGIVTTGIAFAHSWLALIVWVTLIALCAISGVVGHRRLVATVAARPNEDIGTFARSFDCRAVDPWVIRAVYEELQAELGIEFPFRSSDSIGDDFGIVDEDLEDLAEAACERIGRTMANWERNPYRGKVRTVGDLVHFIAHQPKRCAA